jgi:hypothetical protein
MAAPFIGGYNPFAGEEVASFVPADQYLEAEQVAAANAGGAVPDGTEYIVGAIVIVALLFLIGLRGLGFQAMIAAKLQ